MNEALGKMWNAIVEDPDWETRLDQGHAIITYCREKANRTRLGSPLAIENNGIVPFANCVIVQWTAAAGIQEW